MILNLRATNSQGLSVIFDDSLRLTQGLDLSGLTAQVNTTETTGAGARYQNTRLNVRSLDLEFQVRRQMVNEVTMDDRRAELYRVFTPESPQVRFDFNLSDGTQYYFTAYTTAAPIMPPGKTSNNDAFQLALIQMVCPDPYIYRSAESTTQVAEFNGGFEFPLMIPEGIGIEMGSRSESLSVNIVNEGTGDIGMIVRFKATASAFNPSITNVNTNETLRIDYGLLAGDEVVVNTTKGSRSVVVNRNNTTLNIFNAFDFRNSTFFQLHPGDNLISYFADSGLESLSVTIEFNNRYVGV